jgi:hypothetical protein
MADCSQSLDLNVGRIVTFLVTFSRESNPSSMNSTIHERVVLLDLFLLLLGMQQGAISWYRLVQHRSCASCISQLEEELWRVRVIEKPHTMTSIEVYSIWDSIIRHVVANRGVQSVNPATSMILSESSTRRHTEKRRTYFPHNNITLQHDSFVCDLMIRPTVLNTASKCYSRSLIPNLVRGGERY